MGLLGISYYAESQWRAAARRPKGLAAMIPWECLCRRFTKIWLSVDSLCIGMSDYYRDRVRHGGILSNTFIDRWWNMQVVTNQYGRPGRAAKGWGEDTLDGDLQDDVRERNWQDQTVDTAKFKFLDEPYYASKDFDLSDIEVPLLSVANWVQSLGQQIVVREPLANFAHTRNRAVSFSHLRGNIQGYIHAGSEFKFLRCITGRHDLPFYYDQEVEVQRSFLDALLKDQDANGWKTHGKRRIPVDLVLRKGAPRYNCAEDELRTFPRRLESEWPIARTEYRKFHLRKDKTLGSMAESEKGRISYSAPEYVL